MRAPGLYEYGKGPQRTSAQDIQFAVNQLVEVAVRALSSGINDPFTATNCIDHLGAALAKFTSRKIPSPFRSDGNGQLRIIAPVIDFSQLADAAFDQIRQYGATSVPVLLSLLQTICKVAGFLRREEDRESLLQHLDRIKSMFQVSLKAESDRDQLNIRYQQALRAVETARSGQPA